MLEQLVAETANELNEQDQELAQQMEARFLNVQKDYEKLTFASGSLQKDSQEKQKAIEMLFQSLEKLQKEKADERDMLAAIEVKADKADLGSKVDCNQFEQNMEQVDERMQDLQSQISDQEQHWNEVQQKFSEAMEEKLDRLELKAFRKRLEESWNRSIGDFEKRVTEDTGAGIKKQLPVPFSCLSCDRMLTMQVPGPYPETLPYLQPLPPGKESRHSQRRSVVNGSVSRVPQSCGDHQISSSMMQHIMASPHTSAQMQRLLVLSNKPGMTQLLDSSGHFPRGRNDQLPVAIRAQDESGAAAPRMHLPGTAPQHSWAPGLVQPRRTTTPTHLDGTQRPVLDLTHLVRSQKAP
ncbi:glutamine-rich protein 2-like [Catharus ustulatus]|uniref:glutamine-rich protein 2-like n=1 Tax=Catharus ustulatus TaxID=91951 RepID=UPI001408D601|nr:glutamine-rich protein 2-like [Catharus ustulatus]